MSGVIVALSVYVGAVHKVESPDIDVLIDLTSPKIFFFKKVYILHTVYKNVSHRSHITV